MRLTLWKAVRALCAVATTGLLVGGQAHAGMMGLISDFNLGVGGFTSTRILDNPPASLNVGAFGTSGSGALQYQTTTYVGIEQHALTTTAVTLAVGEELQADFAPAYTGVQDIGLYVGAGHPTPDVRANYVNIYVRNNGQVFSRGFNGASEFPLSGGGTPALTSLFIARTAVDVFELGYYNGLARTVMTTRTIAGGNAAGIGNSVGAYVDIRGLGIVGGLDNLRLIPEPSSFALVGLAGLALGYRRRG